MEKVEELRKQLKLREQLEKVEKSIGAVKALELTTGKGCMARDEAVRRLEAEADCLRMEIRICAGLPSIEDQEKYEVDQVYKAAGLQPQPSVAI